MLDSILTYYGSSAKMTDLGMYQSLLQGFPDEIEEIVKVVQGLLVHIFWAEREGRVLSEQEKEEVNLRSATQLIARTLYLDSAPLTTARRIERRVVGNCRDFSVLTTAILRAKGVPARARCGFGTYFLPDHYEDHWVCEYWKKEEARWAMVDAQLNPFQQAQLQIDFNPLNVPPDRFIPAGRAWHICRTGQQDPEHFGIFDMRSWWFIRGNVGRDVLALNKIEILPWDGWGIIMKDEKAILADDLDFVDYLAELSILAEGALTEITQLCETDERISLPENWEGWQ